MANEPCFGALAVVPAPAVEPVKFGLFSVGLFPEVGADPHWQMGVEWEPVPCTDSGLYACPACGISGSPSLAPAKTYRSGTPRTFATPFTVYGSFKCSPVGRWADAYDRARDHLLATRERAVELAVANGSVHTSQALQDSTSVDITPTPGTPVSVPQAIALLEAYGGANGNGQFVIFMNRRESVLANATGTVVAPNANDTQLRTVLNTPVAAVSGWNGRTGPNNVAAGTSQAWVFALGRPVIRQSDVFFTPPGREGALSQRDNDFEVLAEQTYSVGWSCFTAAVLVQSV